MDSMESNKEYYAFISYKREDEKWAKWLANELEHYHLPITLNGKELPKNLRPVFRDVDELAAGSLPEQIYHALTISKNLIVVCSPRSAKSEWVNKEIEDFIKIKGGKTNNIYPFIIEGVPFSRETEKECFPDVLRHLPANEERLGGNINEQGGRNAAVVKIIAGMLGMDFDSLWNKYEREQRRRRLLFSSLIGLVAIIAICIAGYIWNQNRQLKEKDWRMMENQARAVANLANKLTNEGDAYTARLITLEVLPQNLKSPERPFLPEVEAALRRACNYSSAILRGPEGLPVYSIAFSNDGTKIAAVYGNGDEVILWDCYTGGIIRTLEQDTAQIIGGLAYSCSFSPDDKLIMCAEGRTVRFWDAKDGKFLKRLHEESNEFKKAVFSPKGNTFALSTFQGIRIYDTKSFQLQTALCANENETTLCDDFAYSKDGKLIAAVYGNGTVRIWDVNNKELIRTITGNKSGYFHSIDFSPDGLLVAVGGSGPFENNNQIPSADNYQIMIWDISSGILKQKLFGHTYCVNTVAFDYSGKRLISASRDNTVRIWDVDSGQLLRTINNESDVKSALLSADGKVAYTIEGNINVENAAEWNPVSKILRKDNDVEIYAFNGTEAIVGTKDSVLSVDISTGIVNNIIYTPTKGDKRKIMDNYTVVFEDCKRDVAINGNRVAIIYSGGETVIFDTSSKKPIKRITSTDNGHNVDYNRDGTFLLTVTRSDEVDSIKIWDTKQWKVRSTFTTEGFFVYDAKFSPSTNTIAFSSWDSLCVADIQTGKITKRFGGHKHCIRSLSFSTDGNMIVTTADDNLIKIWDLHTGKLNRTILSDLSAASTASFSPDGRYVIATELEAIGVWDVQSGIKVYEMDEHMINNLFIKQGEGFTSALFSPKGDAFISSSKDNCIRFTTFPPLQQLIDENRERFKNRQLTPEERKQYYLD